MARPRHEERFLIQIRNSFIFKMKEEGINQSDIARIFRIPRNTVSTVIKRGNNPLTSLNINQGTRNEYYRNYKRTRYKNDIQFKLAVALRNRIKQVLSSKSKAGSSVRDLGCTVKKLKKHIQNQFTEGMSWANWSATGWHIDHIRPLTSFDLTDKKEFLEAVNYKNLRPMWAKENLSKGKRLL